MAEEMDVDFVTIREAANICRFKRTDRIREAINNRELPRIYFSRRHQLIPRVALIRWLIRRRGRLATVKQMS